jgi:hypothetical protein
MPTASFLDSTEDHLTQISIRQPLRFHQKTAEILEVPRPIQG